MKKKLKIGVLFGGRSAEHEVSLESARNVIKSLDKNKYRITPILIPKTGEFDFRVVSNFDVIFPVLHGPYGEDGSMQGLLKLAGVPFVGAGVLGSAVGMDKDVMKRLLVEAKLPIGKYLVFRNKNEVNFNKLKKELGLPLFVKPANMGSSVGVSKVWNKNELNKAIAEAFKYDTKILAEEFIDGREVECAVLGNDHPRASLPGEVIAGQEFYSYDAKYMDTSSRTEIPAELNKKTTEEVRKLAVAAFQTLNCEGLGRIDFFIKKNGRVLINEINTLPGFTNISMYPKLWEASGLPLPKLLDKLIELALLRFQKESQLKTSIR